MRQIILKDQKSNSESFVIRQAELKDVPHIARVHVESWRKSFRGIAPQKYLDNLSIEKREKIFRENLSDNEYKLLVAEDADGKIVGFAAFGKGSDQALEFKWELYAIYLSAEVQRKGIGEKLFRRGVKELSTPLSDSLYLEALEVSPYRKFYEKMGGEIVGQSICKLGDENFATVIYGWEDLSKI